MWEIVGVIIAALALFSGWYTVAEKRKVKRIEKYDEEKARVEKERELREELRMANFRGGLTEEIATILNMKLDGYETKEEARASYTKIWNYLHKIDEELVQHFKDSNKIEMSRLASEIVTFADNLRAGAKRSQSSFQHISESYDAYKKLGGNHYVDEQFKYICSNMEICE